MFINEMRNCLNYLSYFLIRYFKLNTYLGRILSYLHPTFFLYYKNFPLEYIYYIIYIVMV